MSDQNAPSSGVKKFWFEWLKPMLVVLLVTGAFRSAIADWNDVPTGSMKPTILEGDRIFVDKVAYDLKVPFTTIRIARWDDPQRGDIVILYSPYDGRRLVKRAVAVPGDTIEMRSSLLYVNGARLNYSAPDPNIVAFIPEQEQPQSRFLTEGIAGRKHSMMLTPRKPSVRDFEAVTVPPGQYFVMGDNRDDSFDSRMFGFVDRNQILGRATGVVASIDPSRHFFPRWHRFFSKLQ